MIIFSDFDGTLRSPDDPSVLDTNLFAIRKWRNAGNTFIIVTSHNLATIEEILPDWRELANFIIVDNGKAIFSHQNRLVYSCETEHGTTKAIKQLIKICHFTESHIITADNNSVADLIYSHL